MVVLTVLHFFYMEQSNELNPSPSFSDNTPIAPTPEIEKVSKSPKRRGTAVLVVLMVLVLIGASAGAFFAMSELDKKDAEIVLLQTELEVTKKQLAETQSKLDQIEAPVAKANDAKRKADLAKFVAAVKAYKATGVSFPSTEPSMFADEFGTENLPKIDDFIDPNTKETYEIITVATVQTPPGLTLGTIQYQWPGTCAGSEFKDTEDESKAAARVLLESGETYCLNI